MHPSAANAFDHQLVRHVHAEDLLDVEGFVELLRLLNGPGEAIEDHVFVAGGEMGEVVCDECDDEVVRHKASTLHHAFHLPTQFRSCFDFASQQISSGELVLFGIVF